MPSITRKAKHRRAHSKSGAIDVRSMADMNRLWNTIRKGPITFVLIYADWCGHCHSFMPHFKAASAASRQVGTAAINETMLNAVNAEMGKNVSSAAEEIKVQGYPTLITVDKNGRIISEVETIRDTPKLTALMNKTAKALNGSKLPNSVAIAKQRKAAAAATVPKPSIPASATATSIMPESAPTSIRESAQEEELLSMAVPPRGEEEEDTLKLDMPSDMANTSLKRGGSLYSAMAGAAYQLAPAGILMALATRKPSKSRKQSGGSKHSSRSKRSTKRSNKRNNK